MQQQDLSQHLGYLKAALCVVGFAEGHPQNAAIIVQIADHSDHCFGRSETEENLHQDRRSPNVQLELQRSDCLQNRAAMKRRQLLAAARKLGVGDAYHALRSKKPEQTGAETLHLKQRGGRAGMTTRTVLRCEHGEYVTVETLLKLKAAFEEAGVTWVPENGGPAGTRPPR